MIVISGGATERARVLLHLQQYRCITQPSSLKQYVHHYYKCITSSTMRCIEDQVTNPSLYIGNYFCSLIDGTRIEKVPVEWAINGYPTITLDFLTFSLRHSNWHCTWAKLVVKFIHKTTKYIYCGKRLPWKQHLEFSKITLLFESNPFKPGLAHFIMQYYSSETYTGQNEVIIDSQNMYKVSVITFKKPRTTFLQYHIIVSKLDRIRIEMVENCWNAEVVCYDGPGSRSPILSKQNYTIISSFYQTMCYITSSPRETFPVNESCFIYQHSPARFGVLRGLIPFEDIDICTFDCTMFSLDLWYGWKDVTVYYDRKQLAYNKGYKHYIKKTSNHDIISLEVNLFKFVDSFVLYEEESCIYGGLFLMGWTDTNEMKQLCSLCRMKSPMLATLSFPAQNITAFTVLIIIFDGCSLEMKDIDIWIPFKLRYGSVININEIISNENTFRSEATVTKMQQSYIFQSLGLIDQKVNIHTLFFNTKYHINAYISFNIFDDEVMKSKCITCYASFYRILSNYVPNIKEPREITPNSENVFYSSMLEMIRVDESDCEVPVIWSVSIDVREKKRVYGSEDQETVTNIILAKKVETLIFHYDPSLLQDKNWWCMVHLQEFSTLTRNSWHLHMKVDDTVTDIFLEKLINNNVESLVYRWKKLIRFSETTGYHSHDFMWLTHCSPCNIDHPCI